MKVKVGDKVKVIAGSDKGKEGKVLKVDRLKNRVIVEGIHIVKKHMKPTRTNETGGILEVEAPIHASNVKVIESNKKSAKEVKATPKKEKAETKSKKTETKKAEPKKAPAKKTVTKKTEKVGEDNE